MHEQEQILGFPLFEELEELQDDKRFEAAVSQQPVDLETGIRRAWLGNDD